MKHVLQTQSAFSFLIVLVRVLGHLGYSFPGFPDAKIELTTNTSLVLLIPV